MDIDVIKIMNFLNVFRTMCMCMLNYLTILIVKIVSTK